MRVINIGKLNKRITFMKLQDKKDALGQSKKVLSELRTVWASLYPVRGSEYYEIQKIQSKVTHKCYIRYCDGIDTNCFIKYKDKTYSIESVIDVNLEHKMLEIMCTEYNNKAEMEYEEDGTNT